jgi:hypothetical protein
MWKRSKEEVRRKKERKKTEDKYQYFYLLPSHFFLPSGSRSAPRGRVGTFPWGVSVLVFQWRVIPRGAAANPSGARSGFGGSNPSGGSGRSAM